jgi:hypothetical protein
VGCSERTPHQRAADAARVELLAPIALREARHTCASLMVAAG